jgi:hypothetical protein
VKNDCIELTYFSGAKHLKIIESDVRKQMVFEITVSRFKNKEYVKGIVRDLLYDGRTGRKTSDSIFANMMQRASLTNVPVTRLAKTTKEIESIR